MMRSQPGTYAVVLLSLTDSVIRVGRVGQLQVRPGFYVYVGSALGPGGVRARIAHHRRISNRPHWHIDYLRHVTQLEEVWYTYDTLPHEHQWAYLIETARNAVLPMSGFGSSDCDCEAHLFFFRVRPSWSPFRRRLRAGCGVHKAVYRTCIGGGNL